MKQIVESVAQSAWIWEAKTKNFAACKFPL